LLECLAAQAANHGAPSDNIARNFEQPSAAVTPIRPPRISAASKTSPIPAVITKINRMKTRKGDSMF
jgi:hypothetical protein